MRECNVEQNKSRCSCTYEPCNRKGICCQCVRHHRQRSELPACFFPQDVESTYNRSLERFIETFNQMKRW